MLDDAEPYVARLCHCGYCAETAHDDKNDENATILKDASAMAANYTREPLVAVALPAAECKPSRATTYCRGHGKQAAVRQGLPSSGLASVQCYAHLSCVFGFVLCSFVVLCTI
jgi:hypothetical protein